MADHAANGRRQERYLPCVLERLTDRYPRATKEGREHRTVSLRQYRNSVLRDLAWLLNCVSHPAQAELDGFRHVRRSVLGYGIHGLSGSVVSRESAAELERRVRDAIAHYEPRINPGTLSVRVLVTENEGVHEQNTIALEITGELYAEPVPEQLYIKTELDLETGECDLTSQ